jgi:hypothetical protein
MTIVATVREPPAAAAQGRAAGFEQTRSIAEGCSGVVVGQTNTEPTLRLVRRSVGTLRVVATCDQARMRGPFGSSYSTVSGADR